MFNLFRNCLTAFFNNGVIEQEQNVGSHQEINILRHPKDVFPQEVWDAILHHVEDPADKLKFIRTDPWFQTTFRTKSPAWQFSEVLPILLQNFENGFASDKQLTLAIRNLRLVSSFICRVIDNYTKNHCCQHNSIPWFLNCFEVSEEKFADFVDLVIKYLLEGIPLLGNQTGIRCWWHLRRNANEMDADSLPRNGPFIDMLEICGENLRSVDITLTIGEEVDDKMILNFLKKLFEAVPSLNELKLNLKTEGTLPLATPNIKMELPEVPDLSTLELTCDREAFQVAFSLPIIEYFAELTSLHIQFALWKNEYHTNDIFFPKLVELQFILVPNETLQNELYVIFLNLDAPQLQSVSYKFQSLKNNEENEDALTESEHKSACLIQMVTLASLGKGENGNEWVLKTDDQGAASIVREISSQEQE